jgi:glucuronide carrier protein
MLLSVALFSVPGALSAGGALVYAYLSYALFGLVYSLVNIPFGSLSSAMTQLPQERAKLASARTLGAADATSPALRSTCSRSRPPARTSNATPPR